VYTVASKNVGSKLTRIYSRNQDKKYLTFDMIVHLVNVVVDNK